MEYKSENKICQNCKKDFIIEPDDFSFYDKINIPVPVICSDCRKVRIMSFVNIRSFYKRNCNLCNKPTITIYKNNDPAPVYCVECWNSDNWDPDLYNLELDLSKSFFLQWNDLYKKFPRPALRRVQMVNSEYTNLSVQGNNCYLGYSMFRSENISYSENVDDSKNCHDCLFIKNNEWCYEVVDSTNSYNCSYLSESKSCIDSHFLFDCTNCQNCFMSSNIRNKKYVFRGKQLSKEDYIFNIKKEGLNTYSNIKNLIKEFKVLKQKSLHKYADITNSVNASGNHVINSRNIKDSYFITKGENVVGSIRTPEVKDLYNCFYIAGSELLFGCVSCSLGAYKVRNSMYGNSCKDMDYSFFCMNCENVFGCFGLKNKKYCIFNRQYSQNDYFNLVSDIKKKMLTNPYVDNVGQVYQYGDFFPSELSPFSYNETMARDYYPLTEDEVIDKGFVKLENKNRIYNITKKSSLLPDDINDSDKSICDEIVECEHKNNCSDQCFTAFKILPEDLIFYKKMNIPLPRLCSNCRHYERVFSRPPNKLWHRTCMKEGCTNTFETSYSPDRPEIIYCERCYQQEVY